MLKEHGQGSRPPSKARVLTAGLIGNVMEWYDFALYGYFATVIGQQFFPSTNPTASLIGAFGAFAAGFIVRPLGGIVYGRIGDLVGRRRALTLSVIAMAIPTVAMAFLPTHAQMDSVCPSRRVVWSERSSPIPQRFNQHRFNGMAKRSHSPVGRAATPAAS